MLKDKLPIQNEGYIGLFFKDDTHKAHKTHQMTKFYDSMLLISKVLKMHNNEKAVHCGLFSLDHPET